MDGSRGSTGADGRIRVLLAGESWVSASTHFKGWDFFSSTVYETGIRALSGALDGGSIALEHMPGHLVPEKFPLTRADLDAYRVIILSDIGSNSLLLHPATWLSGKTMPNRLTLLREWVMDGGGLAMCGGYYSFAGIGAAAKYYRTAIEEILPVGIHTFDDRVEVPEGVVPEVVQPAHPILKGIEGPWPALLGYNELLLREGGDLIVRAGTHPLLAVASRGKGRTLAWASDIGPHWCPEAFTRWGGYATLWRNAMGWLAGGSG
jgi:uncharacterized membrane protein